MAVAAAGGGGGGAGGGDLDLRRWANLSLRDFRDESEREFIKLKLREFDWNISRTAQALGIERTNLHKRLRALGIERD
jgi:transcriptional regulator of acetoin/glycerol metabolism